MRVFWCDIRPLLAQPGPLIRWCSKQGLSLDAYLCLDDAVRHLAGLQLRRLAGAGAPHSGDSISISHSGGLVVCALGATPLGLDTEEVRASPAALPAEYFTVQERRWINLQPQPLRAFFRLWTRKESLIKAEGSGLSRMLSLPSLVEKGILLEQVGPVFLWELPILPQRYVTSVCAGQPGQADLHALSVHQLFPA
ncbi:MAG TPA: 4'-phosphopantetheinyl transferase superfamily protein [Candidatus Enterenecus stercoripullorum]|nr:4'-phosphopantetheinyl transferase superfamily protein [Candidatus Enterenecus stercoripullorum]